MAQREKEDAPLSRLPRPVRPVTLQKLLDQRELRVLPRAEKLLDKIGRWLEMDRVDSVKAHMYIRALCFVLAGGAFNRPASDDWSFKPWQQLMADAQALVQRLVPIASTIPRPPILTHKREKPPEGPLSGTTGFFTSLFRHEIFSKLRTEIRRHGDFNTTRQLLQTATGWLWPDTVVTVLMDDVTKNTPTEATEALPAIIEQPHVESSEADECPPLTALLPDAIAPTHPPDTHKMAPYQVRFQQLCEKLHTAHAASDTPAPHTSEYRTAMKEGYDECLSLGKEMEKLACEGEPHVPWHFLAAILETLDAWGDPGSSRLSSKEGSRLSAEIADKGETTWGAITGWDTRVGLFGSLHTIRTHFGIDASLTEFATLLESQPQICLAYMKRFLQVRGTMSHCIASARPDVSPPLPMLTHLTIQPDLINTTQAAPPPKPYATTIEQAVILIEYLEKFREDSGVYKNDEYRRLTDDLYHESVAFLALSRKERTTVTPCLFRLVQEIFMVVDQQRQRCLPEPIPDSTLPPLALFGRFMVLQGSTNSCKGAVFLLHELTQCGTAMSNGIDVSTIQWAFPWLDTNMTFEGLMEQYSRYLTIDFKTHTTEDSIGSMIAALTSPEALLEPEIHRDQDSEPDEAKEQLERYLKPGDMQPDRWVAEPPRTPTSSAHPPTSRAVSRTASQTDAHGTRPQSRGSKEILAQEEKLRAQEERERKKREVTTAMEAQAIGLGDVSPAQSPATAFWTTEVQRRAAEMDRLPADKSREDKRSEGRGKERRRGGTRNYRKQTETNMGGWHLMYVEGDVETAMGVAVGDWGCLEGAGDTDDESRDEEQAQQDMGGSPPASPFLGASPGPANRDETRRLLTVMEWLRDRVVQDQDVFNALILLPNVSPRNEFVARLQHMKAEQRQRLRRMKAEHRQRREHAKAAKRIEKKLLAQVERESAAAAASHNNPEAESHTRPPQQDGNKKRKGKKRKGKKQPSKRSQPMHPNPANTFNADDQEEELEQDDEHENEQQDDDQDQHPRPFTSRNLNETEEGRQGQQQQEKYQQRGMGVEGDVASRVGEHRDTDGGGDGFGWGNFGDDNGNGGEHAQPSLAQEGEQQQQQQGVGDHDHPSIPPNERTLAPILQPQVMLNLPAPAPAVDPPTGQRRWHGQMAQCVVGAAGGEGQGAGGGDKGGSRDGTNKEEKKTDKKLMWGGGSGSAASQPTSSGHVQNGILVQLVKGLTNGCSREVIVIFHLKGFSNICGRSVAILGSWGASPQASSLEDDELDDLDQLPAPRAQRMDPCLNHPWSHYTLTVTLPAGTQHQYRYVEFDAGESIAPSQTEPRTLTVPTHCDLLIVGDEYKKTGPARPLYSHTFAFAHKPDRTFLSLPTNATDATRQLLLGIAEGKINSIETMQLRLDHGGDASVVVNRCDGWSAGGVVSITPKSLVELAIEYGGVQWDLCGVVDALLEGQGQGGADVDCGRPSLPAATQLVMPTLVDTLLNHHPALDGLELLHKVACANGAPGDKFAIVTSLLAASPSLATEHDQHQAAPPFHFFCQFPLDNPVAQQQLLLSLITHAGDAATLSARDTFGYGPIHRAALTANPSDRATIPMLCSAKKDVNETAGPPASGNMRGKPLQLAARKVAYKAASGPIDHTHAVLLTLLQCGASLAAAGVNLPTQSGADKRQEWEAEVLKAYRFYLTEALPTVVIRTIGTALRPIRWLTAKSLPGDVVARIIDMVGPLLPSQPFRIGEEPLGRRINQIAKAYVEVAAIAIIEQGNVHVVGGKVEGRMVLPLQFFDVGGVSMGLRDVLRHAINEECLRFGLQPMQFGWHRLHVVSQKGNTVPLRL
ncbi:unnamed protein product [Vitrella brassicaformis CCMP3155]|uniref:Uncharacterized protein n=3 Tax=Vitrella brassicaformis TaxID=1169539 RepID=A0A0G4GRQ2_VITBC|nr:unnamed protein product [Vitrella brassicaformis CCMP3155]|eukprot:CEM33267.1 unnamed protein product [Vitrella brassicaformis CCMP3155]